MSRVYLSGSGSEAIEAAIKLCRLFFWVQGQQTRVNFIARERSYHGNTIGALSLSEFSARKTEHTFTDGKCSSHFLMLSISTTKKW